MRIAIEWWMSIWFTFENPVKPPSIYNKSRMLTTWVDFNCRNTKSFAVPSKAGRMESRMIKIQRLKTFEHGTNTSDESQFLSRPQTRNLRRSHFSKSFSNFLASLPKGSMARENRSWMLRDEHAIEAIFTFGNSVKPPFFHNKSITLTIWVSFCLPLRTTKANCRNTKSFGMPTKGVRGPWESLLNDGWVCYWSNLYIREPCETSLLS